MLGTLEVLVGNMVIGMSNASWMLLIGRAIGGIGFGSELVQIPMYCSEISQPLLRTTISSITVINIASGFASIHVLHTFLYWRWFLAVACGMCALLLVAQGIILPESHIWLMEKKKDNEARNILIKLRGNEQQRGQMGAVRLKFVY